MLHKENQHVISSVLPDSPAYEEGIRDGDYLLEVSGHFISFSEAVLGKITLRFIQFIRSIQNL